MSAEHTPTPWKAVESCVKGCGWDIVSLKTGEDIPEAYYRDSRFEKEEDAKFICLACNNHDALVEACEIMKRCSLSEMRQYCIKNNIHYGISDFSVALLMQRIAGFVLAKMEEEK